MKQQHLMPSQTAQVRRMTEMAGFDPDDFSWVEVTGGFAGFVDKSVPATEYQDTKYFFAFAENVKMSPFADRAYVEGHCVHYAPAKEKPDTTVRDLDWDGVRREYLNWLTYLRRELDAEDYWRELVREEAGALFPANSQAAREPFTEEEQGVLDDRLEELGERVSRLEELRTTDREVIRGELEALREELGAMRRGSWVRMALGTVLNLSMERIPIEVAKEIWASIQSALIDALSGNVLPPG